MKDFINSYDRVKNAIESAKVRNIFNLIDGDFFGMGEFEYFDVATVVFDLVAKNSTGFVVDICNRVRDSIIKGHAIVLSEKQRWCVAFAAMKIDAAMVDELAKEDAEILKELEKEEVTKDDESAKVAAAQDGASDEIESETVASVNEDSKETLSIDDICSVRVLEFGGQVFIHLKNGKTIRWSMTLSDIKQVGKIRRKEGIEAFHREICRLFNEYDPPSAEDCRFFELSHKKKVCGFLSGDEEEEYHDLLTKSDF